MKTRATDDVWSALEREGKVAASLRARADLMIAIAREIRRHRLTQTEAAAILGVSQPRISDLMRGRIDRFSVDTLIDMAVASGLSPRVSIGRRDASGDTQLAARTTQRG